MDATKLLLLSSGYKWLDTLAIIAFIGVLLLCGTYVSTTFLFIIRPVLDRLGGEKQPPTLPYWIPFIGNAFSMATDAHSLYELAM